MKNYLYTLLVFCSLASAQYNWGDGYYQIEKLKTEHFNNFYYTEYEFNPTENLKTLAEIEKLAKENTYPNIRYNISKEANKTASVSIYVNNNLFSFAHYKNGLLDGQKTIYYGNGNPFHEIDYVNGKANGSVKIYNEKNELAFETEYVNNVKEGKRIFYINKRKIKSIECTYKNNALWGDLIIKAENSNYYGDAENDIYHYPNDLKNGKVKRYVNDKLIEEYELLADELHGTAIIYNIGNDKMYAKIPYQFGRKHGIVENYNKNGELLTKSEFKYGKKVGKHEKFSPYGKLESIEFYDEEGNKIGTWISYNDEKKQSEITYNADGSYKKVTFDDKENIKSISNYTSSHTNTGLTQLYKNGLLESESFTIGNFTKWAKKYYQNGTLFTIETQKGENYEREYFDAEGKSIHLNKVNDLGKRIGIHKNGYLKNETIIFSDETYFDENGNKIKWIYYSSNGERTEYLYRNNSQHGKSVRYDSHNKAISETYYYETNGQSKMVSKENFEQLMKNEKK